MSIDSLLHTHHANGREFSLIVLDRPGYERYGDTLTLQENLVEVKARNRDFSDMLILVEHEEVYTVGRSVPTQETLIRQHRDLLPTEPPWIEVGRGGQATFHGPGQLVAYPVFDLTRHGKDVHVFLRKLEEVIIETLKQFEIHSFTRPGLTGVWVQSQTSSDCFKKIASLGIGIRRWISYHGLALNVTTNLNYFRAMEPCGQSGDVMTSLEEIWQSSQTKSLPSMKEVKEALSLSFTKVFGFNELRHQHQVPLSSVEAKNNSKHDSEVLSEKPLPQASRQVPSRPSWLRVKAPGDSEFLKTREIVKSLRLVTVCEEARCPNIGECWSHHTATFMIMGDLCTRRCSFCSVKDGTVATLQPLNPDEPSRVAQAVHELGLKHIVVTSVNRDDLPDMGASHFDATVKAIHAQNPDCQIELLIPDMQGKKELLETILQSGLVDVLNHNLETVPRLYRRVRPGAALKRSLSILRFVREIQPSLRTKSGIMVGLGETKDEVLAVMDELRAVDCNILTIGQYLQPTKEQLPVERFVTPEEFAAFKSQGLKRGFSYVESGPLVRSSYHAWQHVESQSVDSPSGSKPQVLVVRHVEL